jgi:O-antigen/teichoic acid export membrane protein
MRYERRIFKNAAVLMLGRVVGDLFMLLFTVQFARTFGAKALGQYSFAMSIGAVLAIFVSCGLNAPLIRDLSREPEAGPLYVGNVLLTQALFAAVAWLLLNAISMTIQLDAQAGMVLLLVGSYQLLYRLSLLTRVQFNAHHQMEYPALLEAAHKIFIFAIGAGGIYLYHDPLLALSAYPAGALALLAVGWGLCVHRFGPPLLRPNWTIILGRLHASTSFFLTLLVAESMHGSALSC